MQQQDERLSIFCIVVEVRLIDVHGQRLCGSEDAFHDAVGDNGQVALVIGYLHAAPESQGLTVLDVLCDFDFVSWYPVQGVVGAVVFRLLV